MSAVLEEKTAVLDVRELTKSFGQVRALDKVNFSVQPGRSLVVIGGSGSGKTLLLKSILGVVTTDSGQVLVDGQDMTGRTRDNEDFLDRFGMLFQQSALFDSMPVWRNIAFKILKGQGADETAAKKGAVEALGRVGLRPEVADLYPSELSGGMQKRVGLARAFAGRPEFLFLDEPTAGLDPIMSNSISELIIDMKQDKNVTCMIVSSDLASVRKISDDVLMLHEGQVVWSGPTKELDTTDNPYVQQFIKKSAVGPIAVMTE